MLLVTLTNSQIILAAWHFLAYRLCRQPLQYNKIEVQKEMFRMFLFDLSSCTTGNTTEYFRPASILVVVHHTIIDETNKADYLFDCHWTESLDMCRSVYEYEYTDMRSQYNVHLCVGAF